MNKSVAPGRELECQSPRCGVVEDPEVPRSSNSADLEQICSKDEGKPSETKVTCSSIFYLTCGRPEAEGVTLLPSGMPTPATDPKRVPIACKEQCVCSTREPRYYPQVKEPFTGTP